MAAASLRPVTSKGGIHILEDETWNSEIFEENSNRMFTSEGNIDVEACVSGSSFCTYKKLQSITELKVFLDETETPKTIHDDSHPCSRVFFIRQKHTRSEMQISKRCMDLLCSRLQAHPAFGNILLSFRLQTNESSTATIGPSNFYARHRSDPSSFQTAYMLKYVELNGRSDPDPWSIRQMAIYQRFDISQTTSDQMLVQPSDQIKNKFSHLVKSTHISDLSAHWTNLHSICLSTLSHGWRAYIEWIDTLLSTINFNYFFTQIDTSQPSHLVFADLQLLNKAIDILSQMSHALTTNIKVLTLLSAETTRRSELDGSNPQHPYTDFQQNLQMWTSDQSFLKDHVALLQAFADRRSAQLRDVIALQDSNVMLGMNRKAMQEAQTMRTITLVAMIYLPASFTAAFFSMGFIHVESIEGGFLSVSVTRDMWCYLAITVPLMAFTFLAWGAWEWTVRRKARRSAYMGKGEVEKLKSG